MTNIPRDAGFYWSSIHAGDMRRKRGIGIDTVITTLEEGEIRNSHKKTCRVFVKDFETLKKPVHVVADVETGEIVTIAWHTND